MTNSHPVSPLTLSVLPGRLAVTQLNPDMPLAWPAAASGGFWSVTRTATELSVVCPEDQVPAGAKVAGGWMALKLHGPFEFTLTGILTAVLNPLRDAGVGIFAMSTFDTDYVLVGQEHLQAAVTALRHAGHTVLNSPDKPAK